MSRLLRGRSSWWCHDQIHPHAAERAPETVTAATGLPVAAPAPEGGTDDLRAAPRIVDGVPEELLDAALSISWGMGFSHVRRQIAAVMPLHERMVRAKVAEEQAAWLPEILHVVWGFAMREHTGTAQLTPWHAEQALRHVPGAVLDAARVRAQGER